MVGAHSISFILKLSDEKIKKIKYKILNYKILIYLTFYTILN